MTAVGLAPLARQASAATPAEVDNAIKNAVKFLYTQQNKDGHFEPMAKDKENQDWGGYTALATYALLASGEDPQDARLKKAVDFLLKEQVVGTYAVGLRCQVWNLLAEKTGGVPSAPIRAARDRDGQALLAAVGPPNDPEPGLYDYSASSTRIGPRHNSPSQYGVLGMWALEQIGYEVPTKFWELVDKGWRKNQANDGGWAYMPKVASDNPVKASMTAAGVASLFITNDYLHANDGVACKGNITNDNIEQGLQWMGKHFDQVGGDLYSLYGVERIGVASGYKYFGKTDWYAVGAQTLVGSQGADGTWASAWGPIPCAAFGVLFLTRGRAPVAISKLDYETVAKGSEKRGAKASTNWNERPRDIANIVRWIGRHVEKDLNWQIVNFTANVDDLHDSPILYISGDGSLDFNDAECSMLREFIEQGGMILGNADCARQPFVQSFRKLGTTLFPRYEFRELPESHPIYVNEQFFRKKWKNKPKVLGLSNGVRELMLLLPDADASRAWQTRADATRKELYELASNVFLYAVDKSNLQVKGATYIIKDKGVAALKSVKVVRLLAGENPDPEPGGWRRIANLLKNEDKLALDVKTGNLQAGGLAGYKIAHLTGTTGFVLAEAQRQEIKKFVDSGGTLIVDAAGGSPDFGDAAQTELMTIFGAPAKKAFSTPLPIEHLVYKVPGHLITEVKFRRFTFGAHVGRNNGTRLVGIPAGDHIGVFVSRDDLSAGIVGEPMDGIAGYDPTSATALMRNIVLYGTFNGVFPKPTTVPTQPTSGPAVTQPTSGPAATPPTPPVAPPPAAPPATPPATVPAAPAAK